MANHQRKLTGTATLVFRTSLFHPAPACSAERSATEGFDVRLLWVENHAVFVRMAGRQFLAAHELTVVPSLADARAALAAGQFDAVLLDYDLDDGKGDALVESIRRRPARVAVIATSSHSDGNAALLAAGADAACPKTQFAKIEAVLASVTGQ